MAGELVVSTINGAGFDGGNVVINPEFTINQRGAASRTATSSAYNYDRWYYDGTNLLQGVEGNNLRAGTYVISWEGSSTAAYSLNTAAAGSQGGQSYTSVTNGGTITIASVGSNNLWIRFTSDLTNLTKVKVSPGTEASGFVARPYGTELALCQRYFTRFSGDGTGTSGIAGGFQTSTTNSAFALQLPVQMRSEPTFTFASLNVSDFVNFGTVAVASTGVEMSQQSGNFSLSHGSVGATHRPVMLVSQNNTSGFVAFSSEL